MAIGRETFPLPNVEDPLTAPFFAGAAAGELRVPRCETCAVYVWYPTERCSTCDGPLTWVLVSGRGTLFTWAVVTRAFLPAFEAKVPFVTALVALDEDPSVRLCTYIVDSDPSGLTADAPVEVVFRELAFATVPGREVVVPMFCVRDRTT